MSNLKKILPSGAELEIQLASFEECNKLKRAVMAELRTVRLDLGSVKFGPDFLQQKLTPELINTIKDMAVQLIGSEQVEKAVWSCMGRVLYKNNKITKDTFEPEEARGDYLLILKEVLVANLSPFFKSLGSLLSTPALVNSTDTQR